MRFRVKVQSNELIMYMCSSCFSVMIVPKNLGLVRCEVCGSDKVHRVEVVG
jgi:DNA-directed RNA polymerase subunit RPC12/RpoP